MNKHYLDPLFNPRRIVVLTNAGTAADDELVTALAGSKVPVDIVPFGADQAKITIDSPVDLAILRLPPELVAGALEECGRLRIRAAIVFAAASPPADGAPTAAESSKAWRDIARRHQIHLLGPQTMGLQRPHLALNASRLGDLARPGPLALVTQSGALGGAVLDWASESSIGFSTIISLGGDSGVRIAQVLDFLAADQGTQSILLYLEGVTDARIFMSALRAAASIKPVIVLKAGRRPEGKRAAVTHSGALVGRNSVFNAALRRAGAVRVRFFTQLFAAARCLASRYRPCGQRLAIITNGGGPGVLAADWSGEVGVQIVPTSQASVTALLAALPPRGSGAALDNPIDLGEEAAAAEYVAAMNVLARDPAVDGILLMCSPKRGVDPMAIAQAVADAGKPITKPLLACWMGDKRMRAARHLLEEAGIPSFRTPEAAVDSFANIASFHQNQQLLQQTPHSLSSNLQPDVEGARIIIESVLAERRSILTEMESKSLLSAFHIKTTRTMLARTATEALMIGSQLGYPVALKISSPDIPHKSEAGGVALGVRNASEVRSRFAEMTLAIRTARPEARIEGLTVQEMSVKPNGREVCIGVVRDPLFGPIITFGAGGTMIELIRDRSMELPPLNGFLARRLIERTRVAQTLHAHRGIPEADIGAIEDLLVRVSEMVCELPWLKEMDINPVIVDEHGALAVDARIVVEQGPPIGADRHSHMAIMPYPAHLAEEVPLPDGQTYLIRPIRPEDADHLQTFVRSLSSESRYFRFISSAPEISPKALVRYTQIDYHRELALVAVANAAEPGAARTEKIVGVARYLLNPGGDSAEFAVVVADDWAGRGLGSRLMNGICEVARNKGVQRIEGYILANNRNMLKLMRGLGFTISADPDDPSMRVAAKTL
ncbi:MAG: bifunctional acetate--CoA ligase family protein/GNAT family N-acetyltransferase [Betaproteobacteria bacterium]|nr:bifunctional acetate--CoA ligase family protein/GNAT family N-acetyltransferase [Betaproteobacteria bacterium]